MLSREIFSPLHADGGPPLVFDFSDQLVAGETISTAAVSMATYAGTDASPSGLLSGSETISGAKVTQALVGGEAGVIYSATCEITTSASRTINKVGLVAVIESAP